MLKSQDNIGACSSLVHSCELSLFVHRQSLAACAAEISMEYLKFSRTPSGRISVDAVYSPCTIDEFGRDLSSCPFRREFDSIVACPGWRFSTAPFEPGAAPPYHINGKLPALRPGSFESASIPGLYFAGALMHGHDYRVSSGGFIHGFRYLCRALHRHLEELEIDDETAVESSYDVTVGASSGFSSSASQLASSNVSAWPHTDLSSCGLRALVTAMLRRINLAAGPFQMFGGLADVLLLHPLTATDAFGFLGASPQAPLVDPASFPPPNAQCATESLRDPFSPFFKDESSKSGPDLDSKRKSDAIVERALRGALYEEVPVGAVPEKTARWAKEHAKHSRHTSPRNSGNVTPAEPAPAEWITLTLEFGRPLAPRMDNQRGASLEDAFASRGLIRHVDPFSRLRANGDPHSPEKSRFLHPVLRYYDASSGGDPAPLSELHIIENFDAEWTLFRPHVLALARWLQVWWL